MYFDMLVEGMGYVEKLEVEVFLDIYNMKWDYKTIMNTVCVILFKYPALACDYFFINLLLLDHRQNWKPKHHDYYVQRYTYNFDY